MSRDTESHESAIEKLLARIAYALESIFMLKDEVQLVQMRPCTHCGSTIMPVYLTQCPACGSWT